MTNPTHKQLLVTVCSGGKSVFAWDHGELGCVCVRGREPIAFCSPSPTGPFFKPAQKKNQNNKTLHGKRVHIHYCFAPFNSSCRKPRAEISFITYFQAVLRALQKSSYLSIMAAKPFQQIKWLIWVEGGRVATGGAGASAFQHNSNEML